MFAIIFPGQGSQCPGMGEDLYNHYPEAKQVFDRVQNATGIDVADLCFHSDVDKLRQTQYTQIALYTCGLAAWSLLQSQLSQKPFAMAGHSVGEYTALAAAGVITLEDGAKLVQKRGDLMARSGQLRAGAMVAVLGLSQELVEDLCQKASEEGDIVVANYNCPGQFVVSGDRAAVQYLTEQAKSSGAARVLPLNVSGAFHSPLMESSAESMAESLNQCQYRAAAFASKVYSNVTAENVEDHQQWPALLKQQLKSSVLWAPSVENMIRDGVDTFIECGSGEVLCGLIKRINKSVVRLCIEDKKSLEQTLEELNKVSV